MYIQKNQKQFPNVFISKKVVTFQKARKFPLRFLHTESSKTLDVTGFNEIFEVVTYIKKA